MRKYTTVLVKIAQGFSNVRMRSQPLFQQLARSALLVIDDFHPGQLVTLMKAFATMGVEVPEFMEQLQLRLRGRVPELAVPSLGVAVSSLARIGHRDEVLLDELTMAVLHNLADFPDAFMSKLAAAYRVHGGKHAKQIFEKLRFHVIWRLEHLELKTLLQVVVAFKEAEMFEPLWRGISQSLGEKAPSEQAEQLTRLMWVLARLKIQDDVWTFLVTRQVVLMASHFSSEQLATVVWACGKLETTDSELIAVLVGAVNQRMTDFQPQEVSKLVWGFSNLSCKDELETVWSDLTHAISDSITRFTTEDLTAATLAFASLDLLVCPELRAAVEELFAQVARACDARFDELSPKQLVDLAWAFAKVGGNVQADTLVVRIAFAAGNFQNVLHVADAQRLAWALQTLQKGDLQLPLPAVPLAWPGLRSLDPRVAESVALREAKKEETLEDLGIRTNFPLAV